MDLTQHPAFCLSAKEQTERAWQIDIERRAQAAEDNANRPQKLLTAAVQGPKHG